MRTLDKLESSHLTLNESAWRRCQAALELKDRGDYEGAREVMRPFWKRFGERPEIEGLNPPMVAEVMLHVGILTRWIGSKNQIKEAQDTAKDLISESITLFEALGDLQRIAAARAELAFCYWWAGALDEARIMLTEALKRISTEGNTRANALIFLAVVEWSAARYSQSLKLLTENAALFKKIPNCYNQALLMRFKVAGTKLAEELGRDLKTEDATELLFHKLIHLPDEILKFERDLISNALAKVDGRITHAARLLGIRYQTLASIIESRHPELLKQRTAVYRRRRR